MEGDGFALTADVIAVTFQSTPSAWRETTYPFSSILNHLISIHSLRMEGDPWDVAWDVLKLIISIHSLRMEGDSASSARNRSFSLFQSTPSAWRETLLQNYNDVQNQISIHSLRMEGDRSSHLSGNNG